MDSSSSKPVHANGRLSLLGLMGVHITLTGGGYVVNKLALREFHPLAFGFWRLIIGLIGLLLLTKWASAWPKIEKRDWTRVILLAAVAVPVNQLIYLYGMSMTVPSHASLLYGTTAVFALFLSAALGYERIMRHKVLAIAVSLSGLALVVTRGGQFDVNSSVFTGDVLIFAAVLAWATYTVLGKPLVIKYGAVPATCVLLIVGTVISLPFLITSAVHQDYSGITWIGWGGALYSGLLLTVVAYIVWYRILSKIDPSQVAILTTPQPVVATFLSSFFVGEVIGWPLVIGGLLVIIGVILMDAPAFVRRAGEFRRKVVG